MLKNLLQFFTIYRYFVKFGTYKIVTVKSTKQCHRKVVLARFHPLKMCRVSFSTVITRLFNKKVLPLEIASC